MSFKNLFNKRQNDDAPTLGRLTKFIGHNRWFIAGSSANTAIKTPKDIDIFFYTKEDFEEAVNNIAKQSTYAYITPNAHTYYSMQKPVQLICKYFGTPEEVFDTFDLNVCKKAILPQNICISDPTSDQPLHIAKINYDTFSRFFKYVMYLGQKKDLPILGKSLVDKYISDSSIVEEYYDKKMRKAPVNQLMFTEMMKFYSLRDYVKEQALLHAPELLI